MSKYFAIVENNIVRNVIVADEEFANFYSKENGVLCISYDEINEDDTKVARIGEGFIDGKFIAANQAVELGYLTVDEAKSFGFYNGREYTQTLEDELNILKDKILALNPTAKFPNDVDTDGNNLASKEELEAYLKLLQEKALLAKFEG